MSAKIKGRTTDKVIDSDGTVNKEGWFENWKWIKEYDMNEKKFKYCDVKKYVLKGKL